ncbi:MAG: hypothetical protein KF849_00855 [Rhizobiaceae bacterium]|nr:hypothetical protein [Rhizobiaceae bacterium]
MKRALALLAAMAAGLVGTNAAANDCRVALSYSPYETWVVDGTRIRLGDEERRAHYARALLEKLDLLYFVSPSIRPADIRLSSLYTFMAGDPMNVRRFVSTSAQNDRMRALRQELFGVSRPGSTGKAAPAAETQLIRDLIDDDMARRLMRGHWLSDFPAFVINNGAAGKLREYWRLKANAGDYLFDDSLYDSLQLIDLSDLGTAIRSFTVDRDGKVATRDEGSMLEALTALEAGKATTCVAQLEFRRVWLNRRFLEKYAASDRTGNVHYHGQISAWERLSSAGMDDPTLFPLIREAYFVSSVVLSVADGTVTVERMELTPLVASQH